MIMNSDQDINAAKYRQSSFTPAASCQPLKTNYLLRLRVALPPDLFPGFAPDLLAKLAPDLPPAFMPDLACGRDDGLCDFGFA
jgi:hypothetical protein